MRSSRITQKDVLFLSISFFVIIVAWIAFSLYHTYVTTTISEDLFLQITPINPKFDTATIKTLKSRQKIAPLFELTPDQQASVPALLQPEEVVPTSVPAEQSIEEFAQPSPTEETPTQEVVPTEEPTL